MAAQHQTIVPRPRFWTEPQWIDVAGTEIAYRREGEGEPTLFLHGAGFTGQWLPFHAALAEHVDLICPDHPGMGETTLPEWLDGMDDLVLHYDDLLDALGLEHAHVVGYSLGGWIAAELAAFFPRRLRSLTLVTPVGLRVEGHSPAPIFHMSPEQLATTIFSDPTNMASVLPAPDDVEEIIHGYTEAATIARLVWERPHDLKLDRRLRRVGCPALVVCAEDDRLVPGAIAERYAELLPDARVETIAGTGHALIVERPEETAAAVAAFIEETSR
jgi:pimeloyl-ACP methyl ester carboxylesterase